MEIEKSSLKQALLEAKEIEKSAYANAKKILEETISPKIDEAVKATLKDMENETLNEGVVIDVAPNAELKINVSEDGSSTVTVGETKKEEEITNQDIKPEEEMEKQEEEIYEIEGLEEAETTPVAGTPSETPTEETPAEEATEVETVIDGMNAKLDQMNSKLDKIVPAEETTGAEGEVEIVDDETPAQTEEAPSEVVAEEDVYEFDNKKFEDEGTEEESKPKYVTEDSEEETYEISEDGMEDENIEEIQIIDEDDEEENKNEGEIELDETGELSFTVQRRADQRQKFLNPKMKGHHAPMSPRSNNALQESTNKLKAQYESKLDELKQENSNLKQTLKEYKDSVVVLRKQINEVHTFNGKLSYAYKTILNGGLTKDEKMKIAEEFDKVGTVEEAKKLYNTMLSESKIAQSKNPITEKLKSTKTAAPESTATKTLYESVEVKRMKELAGLI